MESVRQQFQHIKQQVESINQKASEISGNSITFFKPITIDVTFKNAHTCFLQLVNWFYSLTVEVSSPNFNFLTKKIKIMDITVSQDVLDIPKLIHALRTKQNHTLDMTDFKNIELENYCQEWFKDITSKKEPTENEEWHLCIDYIIKKIIIYLDSMIACISKLHNHPNLDIFLLEWKNMVSRDYGVYEFEKILENVLIRYGLEGIFNTNAIVKLEIDKWRKDLKVLAVGFDFKTEADRIIVKYVERYELCPVTGGDLINLGTPPGPHIKDLMVKVREDFYKQPCNRDELLKRIVKNGIIKNG